MKPNSATFISVCFLLLICQLSQIDARSRKTKSATWSEWSKGKCSRSCGGGVRKATRTCMNNRSDGRFNCEGPNVQFTSCNTQDCPDRIDFRALQCSMFNKEPFRGHYYKWSPYYGEDAKPCALFCAVNKTFHAKLADKVVDGTRCRPEGYGICVEGRCKRAGCDRQLGSSLEEDACGVCGGKGKDCKTMKGTYENNMNKGYRDIITILKGASNIRIVEKSKTKNHFALRNIFGKFYLNSKWKLTNYKKFLAAGTLFRYQKDGDGQILVAKGPTSDPLTLVLVGNGDPTNIYYEYYIPEKGHVSHLNRRPRHRQAKSKSSLSQAVAERSERPLARRRPTRNDFTPSADTPLPSGDAPGGWDPRRSAMNYQWQEGTWTKCSASCGEGVQRRAVLCYDMDKRVIAEGKCPEENKPTSTRKCEKQCDVTFRWAESGWTECTRSCNGGEMTSISVCEEITASGSKKVKDELCSERLGRSPHAMKVCNEQPCPQATESKETPCWETLYGCCPDRRTAAFGPDHAGCHKRHADCHNTEYGCCPDGVRQAQGPRYAGCPSGPKNLSPTNQSPTKQELTSRFVSDAGHICHLAQDAGTCADYEVKWNYDSSTGTCIQFWYGGCGGNNNRFDNEQECLAACHGGRPTHILPVPTDSSPKKAPRTDVAERPSPSVVDNVCKLDKDTGTCAEYVTKWFYNRESGRCEQFWYGGCGGNDNRFDTDRDCQEKCRPGEPSSCISTAFGCCEDGVSAARGPQKLGCPEIDCKRTRFGCCPDGNTVALSYDHEGCATKDCRVSRYGCCQDGVSFAHGENYHNCRRGERCDQSPFGCCPDGVAFAKGENFAGCHVLSECERTEFGCCPDQKTVAQGPNGEGCCHYTEFGCCPDGLTVSGPNHERCRIQDCRRSKYGCCRDGVNFARGENYKGCPSTDCRTSAAGCCPDGVTFVSEGCSPPDCHSTAYGCCPDGSTAARGYYHEGCREKDCRQARYGCCPDGATYAKGEEYEGCPTCRETRYGCCPDGVTLARGDNYLGCTLGSCHLSDYGCCPDMRTAASGPEHLGCQEKDCRQYIYGCCEDGITYARGKNMDGCPKRVNPCESTTYGCCEDRRTPAQGPERYGCPETLCQNSEFGCCEDGVTFARGRNYEGCRRVSGCAGTQYGCCEDRRTPAQGPERYGCPETLCQNSEFGCCEDGVTFARGTNYEGCRRVGGCAGTQYGCCEDRRTPAQGPERYGCPETLCQNSEFGCCEDGVTFARGTNYEGCRRVGGCAGTQYGCCEDRRTPAQGPERYGCPETLCQNSEFGCCEDGVTFARGTNYEGCRRVGGCAGTQYGCCEDRRTPAQGPERYGCPETLCQNSEFGCCEDGVTFARGTNYEGCRRVGGCAGTQYGCCEDRRTPAQGPDRYGCPENQCRLSEYGCCPDGRSMSRGPNHEGCQNPDCNYSRYGCCPDGVSFAQGEGNAGCRIELGCEASAYGCCPDMVTAARGPEYAGCPPGGCRATRYGCCPDGVSSADGPNYAGCIVSPTVHSQVDCKSDSDTGTCAEYVSKWFFNVSASRCEQFWYGGCGGNNNRYDSEEECKQQCKRRRVTPTPYATTTTVDLCRLPYDEGSCDPSNAVKRWYYEESSRSCQVFLYSGCDGNANNFESESACVIRCFLYDQPVTVTLTPTELPLSRDSLEVCHLELQAGNCSKQLIRWYYDRQDGRCKNFTYTGCYGNSNRFLSKDNCEAVCSQEAVCHFPEAYGTCQSNVQRYRYDAPSGDCVLFRYSGCNGNANNFLTLNACRNKCVVPSRPTVTTTTSRPLETKNLTGLAACSIEKDESVCLDGVQRTQIAWYYDLTLAACQQFNYSGCGGNNNRFNSAEKCTRTCNPRDICQMPNDSGICLAHSEFWYFNTQTRNCETFIYGGCGGNANRFATESTCRKTCRAFITSSIGQPTVGSDVTRDIKTKDACLISQKPGTCVLPAGEDNWFYNMTEGICQRYDPRECTYHDNKFSSEAECERTCDPRELCMLAKDSGTCYAYSEQFYFDPRTKRCEQFTYGGCGGNANRFPSIHHCGKVCNALMDRGIMTGPERLPDDTKIAIMMCHLPAETGPCRANLRRWYYEVKEARCRQFTYGGCQGNNNRFKTKEECENICSPQVVCSLSRDVGDCTPYHRGYYFNSAVGRCEHLNYGDCYGNANRFYTIELCEETCKKLIARPEITTRRNEPTRTATGVEACHLPKESGSCRARISAWHYDSLDNTCKEFYYGGCQGNGNRFKTKDECEKTCNAYDICNLPKKSGRCYAYVEQYYYNPQSKRCEQFVYGGCDGNANRFASLAKCHIVCRDLIEKPDMPDPNSVTPNPERPVERCHLKKEVGPCRAHLSAWYYDTEDNTCKHFTYGGCKGNGNRFQTREECEKICHPRDICNLPKDSGICFAYSEQYYFNAQTKRCEEFVYGGCGGNANRFVSLSRCLALCHSLIEQTTTQAITDVPLIPIPGTMCHYPKDVGPCRSRLPSWFYDTTEHQCKLFYYGGCQGNDNRFQTKEECQQQCSPQNICQFPDDSGRCNAYFEKYYFDTTTNRCKKFVYGGCGGNANQFKTLDQCTDVCRSLARREPLPTPPATPGTIINRPVEACHFEKKVGPCGSLIPAWYYDMIDHQCKSFYYGGCEANPNKFESKEKCQHMCSHQSICELPKEKGLCYAYSEQYHYNSRTNRCEKFVYGGCGGNANRFATAAQCMDVCSSLNRGITLTTTMKPHISSDVCKLRKLIGPCSYNVTSWYFDEDYGVCSMFIYSGCGGNKNNFKTLEECENVCHPSNDVCNHGMNTKRCQSSKSFWLYDSVNQTCRYLPSGYCEDSPLHFVSESACRKQCMSQDQLINAETNDVCHLAMEEGSCRAYLRVWYYNMEEAICKPFIYGGCNGNKNRFETKSQCENSCNKHSICNLKKEPGMCYGYQDAFYFNRETNKCEHFVYGGCGGNANRFASAERCHEFCGGHLSNASSNMDHKEPSKCQLEPEFGDCQERTIVWYYDYKTSTCSRFYYTGCGGNENRFSTNEECIAACKSQPSFTTYAPVTGNSIGENQLDGFTTIHVALKETLTLHCGELIDNLGERNRVTWTHDGQDIIPDSRRQIQDLNLVVYDVKRQDAGMYSCRKKGNSLASTLDKYEVKIKVPVTIEYGNSHIRVLPRHPAKIPCQTHGVPKPIITWYKDGTEIRSNNKYEIFDNGTLLIYSFMTDDVATYKCLARNDYKWKAEKKVKVTIQDSLNLKTEKSSDNFHVGDQIKLTCMAEGYPNTRLQWFFKDRELYSNSRMTVQDGVLIIRKAEYENSGIYTCRGTHNAEVVNKDVIVRVLSMPDEVPKQCEDRLPINRCRMIVASKLCKRKTFHKNCCVSCSQSMAFRRR